MSKSCVACKRNTPRIFDTDDTSRVWANLRMSAQRRGIDFQLSREEVTALLDAAIGRACPCCGHVMARGVTRHSLTFDRIRNDRGYVANNVHVLCKKCNEIKRDLTGQELFRLAQFVLSLEARAR